MALSLNVKLLTGEVYSLNMAANRTIWDLKIQIAQKSGVPPYQQKLACQNNSHLNLRDGVQLSAFELQSGDTIMMVVKNEESITIFLKNDKGRTSTYEVLPSDKVDVFKQRVQQRESIQSQQFWLTYDGRSLENGHKLSDYNIAPHSTIYLNLRLRGGWTGRAGLLSSDF
ncbi:ubiquitin-like protein ISG15 [Paroedura picta]|uniref:ubiquitin-like protein ISG15 n=1 Tax=Paroedura picta TaxID=143630 RepID=UPI004056645E